MLRTQRQIIATTLRDLHGEQMTRAALDEIVREVRTHYIPLGYEHDPRFPPLGRIIGAQVIELADGEQAAEAILEFWDSDPTQLAIESDDREFPRAADASSPGVRFGRSFLDDEAAAAIAALGEITGSTPVMISKKNLEPIPVLMLILGTFAIGGIAQGFLSKLGEDLYTALRDRLSGLFEHRDDPGLLEIVVGVVVAGRQIEMIVVLESPNAKGISDLFKRLPAALDRQLPEIISKSKGRPVQRVVATWRRGRLVPMHILDSHGVPIEVFEIPSDKQRKRKRRSKKKILRGDVAEGLVFDDASSSWRSFDVVRVGDAASLHLPDLGQKPDDENRKRPVD